MSTINQAYINALLADAAYRSVSSSMTQSDLKNELAPRMTEAQATFLAANFTVKDSIETPNTINPLLGTGFDAVVWEGKSGTPYAGQLYVSMRGTQGGTDIADDTTLASQGVPHDQIRDMVNWWMRISTPSGESAAQIQYGPVKTGVDKDGKDVFENRFTLSTPVVGAGLVNNRIISGVNGHSLGGYLATAFTCLFGSNVLSVNTYNSAGFSSLAASNIQTSYDQISQLVGTILGRGSFGAVAQIQTNYFAANGWNLTTNTWGEMGFNVPGFTQYGQRIGLNQEEGIGPTNHSMYHMTDLLALGSALEKLDPSFTLDKLNTLVKVGSNSMAASYEGVLDGLRRMVLGANVTPTPASDSADATGRSTYHANLKDLTDSNAFKALALTGKVTLSVASAGLATSAKGDFGAFLSLNALSPVVINAGGDATATATLGALDPNLYASWQADKNARLYGDTTKALDYSDNWYADRAAMLQAIVTRNEKDAASDAVVVDTKAPSGQFTLFHDAAFNGATPLMTAPHNGAGLQDQHIFFCTDGGDTFTGYDGIKGDHLYGGAGNDQLVGGAGVDTYAFESGFGKDSVKDADGQGLLTFGGSSLGVGRAGGQLNLWVAKAGSTEYELRVLDDASSTTGKTLVISPKGDGANSVTLSNFNLAQAQGSQGYMGIKLETGLKLALIEAGDGNPFAQSSDATPGAISAQANEGSSKAFTLHLSVPAAAAKNTSKTIAINQVNKSVESVFCFGADATNDGWMRRAA